MPAIVRWSPLRELDSLERRMRRMLDAFDLVPAAFPAADVYETDDEVVVELEAPGFDEKEIDVEVTDHTLVIKGGRTEEKETEERSFRLQERLESTFERRFELPAEVDTSKVSASFSKGVLKVQVGKTAKAEPRKIDIAT